MQTIARDLLIQKKFSAELIGAKMSLIKFHYNIVIPENFEDFHMYPSHQNARTKQHKIRQNVETNVRMNSIVP